MLTYLFGFFSGIIATIGILFIIFLTLYIVRNDYRLVINKFLLTWYNKYKKWKSDRAVRRSYRLRIR